MERTVIGDVVTVPSLGNGKVFRVTEIRADGRVSGPAVSVRRNGGAVEVLEPSASTLYFSGFDVEGLRFVCGASRQAEA